MASELLEEGAPCINGEAAGFESAPVHHDDDEDEGIADSPSAMDASFASGSRNSSASANITVERAIHSIPPEEANKGKVTAQMMETSLEQVLPNDVDGTVAIPSAAAIFTDDTQSTFAPSTAELIETESTAFPSTAAILTDDTLSTFAPSPAELIETEIAAFPPVTAEEQSNYSCFSDTDAAPETIIELPTEDQLSEEAAVATAASTEAVVIDLICAYESAGPISTQLVEISTEPAIASSPIKEVDYVVVATVDSPVVAAADSAASVDNELTAPIATDSVIVEDTSTDPTSSPIVQSPSLSKTAMKIPFEEVNQISSKQEEELPPEMETPLEEVNQISSEQEDELPPEMESIQVPLHWHSKPCIHISSVGGALTEEELQPLFSTFGPMASVVFENERHDAVLIRFDIQSENGDELLAQVREATNNTKLGDKTLIVEPFRPDSLLFVGNLTPSIDDASLKAMFEPHGTVERAFVLHNAEGQSKCYGFVEYSLKSQAMTAKAVMGNINMDGRVLRVEWSDCRRVEDLFSTVLFIDRIPREGSNIEGALKNLFSKYGNIRDSHLAIGTGNQMRGFGFIDFYHSRSADQAHQALDGHFFEGSNIRVSFANPSKSAQSYKFRYGAQSGQVSVGRGGTGVSGMLSGPPPRGLSSRGQVPRVAGPMPLLHNRFVNPARSGMMGYGIGMQFGRGPFDRATAPAFHGSGRGMLGPNSFGSGRGSYLLGNMAPRAGMPVVDNKLPFGQGPVSITSSAIVQVATAQARAREEEAKARAEAARQGLSRSYTSNDYSMNQYQRLQQGQHQQQQVTSYDQHYKQGDFYMHQHAQQASLQPPQHAWNQQHSQQNVQLQRMPYHTSQNFPQQQHMDQNVQNDAYYQQTPHAHVQQHGYAPQYGQQQGYQFQQSAQMYGQVAQQTGDPYQQATQQPQAVYSQQNYGDQYSLQQQASQQSFNMTGGYDASASLDASQQQAYAAYYQQQAQAQAVMNPESVSTAAPQNAQQSYEAQWAAYYASQAAYQQQSSSTEAGQKRSADQMETQNQAMYNYAGYSQASSAHQQQQSQPSTESTAYQGQAANAAAYQQQAAYAAANYQQQGTGGVGYQQATAVATYSAPATTQTGYDQPTAPAVEGAFQQPAGAFQGQTGVFDYSKRPRF